MSVHPPSPFDTLAGSRIALLGFGREGRSTYTFLRERLGSVPLRVLDRNALSDADAAALAADPAVEVHVGDAYLAGLDGVDAVFKAPGVPPALPEIDAARARGVTVTSNADLFLQMCGDAVIGVTGTKGKSTTTALIHHVLRAGGLDVRLGGNIGVPPLSLLEGAGPATTFVVELSSYQLLDVSRSPHIAVLQDVVPEHLNYHGSFDAYVDAKANILRFQGSDDLVLYNGNGSIPTEKVCLSAARRLAFGLERRPESVCFVDSGWVRYREGSVEPVLPVGRIPLLGEFNVVNVLPSVVLGKVFGLTTAVIADAVASFRPLEHRLERAGEIGGVRFVNDSLATVPEAAAAAIRTLDATPVVLVAGGYDRGLDYSVLAKAILERNVRGLVLFSPTGGRLLDALASQGAASRDLPHRIVDTMSEAVEAALEIAERGDVVLMSPASASFGRFRDYRDRGDQFKAEVRRRAESSPLEPAQ